MEKAHDAERKAQIKAAKARSDTRNVKGDGQKKAKPSSKAPGLLKAAILNNAREKQAQADTSA